MELLLKTDNQLAALYNTAVDLLKQLIATPSFSKEETAARNILENYFYQNEIPVFLKKNNLWVANKHFKSGLKTILLNSHLDTVKPNSSYTMDPFFPLEKEGKLFGLGSNDAGASLVSLLACFMYFYEKTNLPYNIIFAASAEEEISGLNGIELLIPELGKIDFAIVGEPTQMKMAIAEKGLLVLDVCVKGKPAHVANGNGENAILKAMDEIQKLSSFQFTEVSPLLGPVKISVTQIQAGTQHNVIPGECNYVVDVRTNELYSHEKVLTELKQFINSEIKPRSLRMKSTGISSDHPLIKSGTALGISAYGSPTTSDKALMPFPALKMGPGDSLRSHTANEFVYLNEIKQGIKIYIELLSKFFENETVE